MAGTPRVEVKEHGYKSEVRALREEHNKVITDLETLRAAGVIVVSYEVEDLGVGADIAAGNPRDIFVNPLGQLTCIQANVCFTDATTGVDGSNTLVIDVFRSGGLDVSLTRTTNAGASDIAAMTITTATLAAGGVVSLAVTQGATADAGRFRVELIFVPSAVAAAAGLTAATVNA